jgi:RNA polymerase sigma factor (TIGR02999 family)
MNESELTLLIHRYQEGDPAAFDRLLEHVYDHLRRIAHAQLDSHRRDAVVNTTVIVHEAYLRLQAQDGDAWQSRHHFLAIAARAMRHIIIDFARRQQAGRRGSGAEHVSLEETQIGLRHEGIETVLDIDRVLNQLAEADPRAANLFEYRFFGGMTDYEAAAALNLPLRTTQREWRRVKAYFAHALAE